MGAENEIPSFGNKKLPKKAQQQLPVAILGKLMILKGKEKQKPVPFIYDRLLLFYILALFMHKNYK